MVYYSKAGEQQKWNLDQGYSQEVLVRLCVDVKDAMLSGNVLNWFNSLQTLYAMGSFAALDKKVDQGKFLSIETGLKKVKNLIDIPDSEDGRMMAIKRAHISDAKQELYGLTKDIIIQLHKAGLIMGVPQKNDPRFASMEM